MSLFDSVVLSGGGSKGILHLGVLHYFRSVGLYNYKNIKEFAGTSIGGVISLLLVCGYEPMEIYTNILKYNNFLNLEKADFSLISVMIKNKGLFPVQSFTSLVKDMVLKKLGKIPTMKELYDITGKKLSICVTNLTKMSEVCVSHISHPNLNCIDVINYTCNVPLIFYEIENTDGDLMIDGGFTNNFPVTYISKKRENILGIVLTNNVYPQVNSFVGYFCRCVELPIRKMMEIHNNNVDNLYLINIKFSYSFLNFNIDHNDKKKLFIHGYNYALSKNETKLIYIKGWDDFCDDNLNNIFDNNLNNIFDNNLDNLDNTLDDVNDNDNNGDNNMDKLDDNNDCKMVNVNMDNLDDNNDGKMVNDKMVNDKMVNDKMVNDKMVNNKMDDVDDNGIDDDNFMDIWDEF